MASPIESIRTDIASAENAIKAHKANIEKYQAAIGEAQSRILVLVGSLEANRRAVAALETWKPDEAPAPESLTIEA